MRRVVHLSTDPGIAFGGTKGASVHLESLAGAFAAAGADVLVLAAAVERAAPDERIAVETIPVLRKGAPAAERLTADAEAAAWVEGRARAFGADLVYERLALHSSAGSVAARSLGIPHLVELNAPLPDEARRYRRLEESAEAERHERRTLRRAAVVLAVSSPLARYARSRGAGRVVLLPNAVDLERYPRPAPIAPRAATAVFTGSLRPWHGIECLARAWRILGQDAPDLLVVGDGPGRELLERVGAHVTGAVRHEAVPALLARADLALAPYALDAPDYFSPLKLFEYLAAGLPTVAADLPGVLDVVDEETAVLVPRGDADALAAAVAALVDDPARRSLLSRRGRALVASAHTWRQRAVSILDLATQARRATVEAAA